MPGLNLLPCTTWWRQRTFKKSPARESKAFGLPSSRVAREAGSSFLKLGRQLNRVRTPKDAGALILAIADELFAWIPAFLTWSRRIKPR